jgi:outer membrane protein TolC
MRSTPLAAAVLVATLLSPSAFALQPLDTFVDGARSGNIDNESARATAMQRVEELDAAWARLGPSLLASASYTRNQYAAIVTLPPIEGNPSKTATITPLNEYNALFTVNVPLVDLGAWSKIRAAKATHHAADERVHASEDDVTKAVVQTYTRVVAGEALVLAADKQEAAAEASLAVVLTKAGAGTASEVDVERAKAEVAKNRQSVADAEYTLVTARNTLHTLTQVEPAPGAPTLADDLHPEPPLEAFLATAGHVHSALAADADAVAAKRNADAAYAALLPTIGASGNELFTNAIGFGTSPIWSLGVTAQIKLDFLTYESARASGAAARVADVAVEKTRRDVHDVIFDAWQLVASSIVKSSAARDDALASTHAAELAHRRYEAGTGTQLEMIQADRDAFTSVVTRIQDDADLVYARAAVRIAAGQKPGTGDLRGPWM